MSAPLFDALGIIIGIVAGLLTGLATGYFFERRQTRAARVENAQLTGELDQLRATMAKLNINVLGTLTGPSIERVTTAGTLAADIAAAAKSMVDGTSRVRIALLYERFCSEEFTVDQVDAAIQSLIDRHHLVRHHDYLEVTV